MLKRVGFVSLWVVATLVATTVALAAVRSVAGQVVDSPGSGLLAASPATTTARDTTTRLPTETSSTTPTSLAREDATKPSGNNGETSTQSKALPAPTSPDAAPATTEAPTAEAPSTPPPTTAPPPASSVPPTTVAGDGDDNDEDAEDEGNAPVSTDVKTFQLVGGWVRIASSPGVVTLDGAGPNPGFTMNIDSSGPESVDVDFRSDEHRSDFEAEWSDGELGVDTEEKVED